MKAYTDFADIYDELMDDFDYAGWASYYRRLMSVNGIAHKTMVDCACGTGSMTIELKKLGSSIIGIDISPRMLEVAAQKCRARGYQIPFICQNMAMLELPREVDAIVCACDGVNYLTSPSDVERFFRASYASLKASGGLLFDISTKYKLETVVGNGFFGEDRQDIAYLWQNSYNPLDHILSMELSFFVKRDDGLYTRFDEQHTQRAHETHELEQLLYKVGFQKVCIYGDRHQDPILPNEHRLHFVAQK